MRGRDRWEITNNPRGALAAEEPERDAPMPQYVEIVKGKLRQVVTRKAYEVIYGPKDWDLLGNAVAREDEDPGDAVLSELPGAEDLELDRMMRRSVADILAWVSEPDDEELVARRAMAVLGREQEGRGRATLLDALSGDTTPAAPGEAQALGPAAEFQKPSSDDKGEE